MLNDILNYMIIKDWDYHIKTKHYRWINDSKSAEERLGFEGIHILVPINAEYTISIIQAFNEATGRFYKSSGPVVDTWEIALKRKIGRNEELVYINDPNWNDTVCICDDFAVILEIEKLREKYGGG